jgi:nitrite reductase (NADH) large subunit
MQKKRLVMVGNGMAGVRTLEELRKIAPGMYDITVFGAEPHGNYNRILLSPGAGRRNDAAGHHAERLDWYRENGITLHAGESR